MANLSIRSRSKSPVKRQQMRSELRESVRHSWPFSHTEETPLTIRADSVYRIYTVEGQDPRVLFDKATRYLESIGKGPWSEEQTKVIMNNIDDMMIHAIFGSNCIERAGLGLDITSQLCQKVLHGESLPDLGEQSPEHTSELLELTEIEPSLKGQPLKMILRGRQEIVQHAKAFQHIVHHFAVLKEELNEDLIKHTHRILCTGVSVIDLEYPEVPWEKYAGIYRTVEVGAGNTMFVVPRYVPRQMAKMCAELADEIAAAESNINEQGTDPFSMAAKYSMRFVEIHPFLDGNGWMCRMILNAILFRFTGVFAPIGEGEHD